MIGMQKIGVKCHTRIFCPAPREHTAAQSAAADTREDFLYTGGNLVLGRGFAPLERLEMCLAALDLGVLGAAKIVDESARLRLHHEVQPFALVGLN